MWNIVNNHSQRKKNCHLIPFNTGLLLTYLDHLAMALWTCQWHVMTRCHYDMSRHVTCVTWWRGLSTGVSTHLPPRHISLRTPPAAATPGLSNARDDHCTVNLKMHLKSDVSTQKYIFQYFIYVLCVTMFLSNPDWTSRNKRGVSLPAVLVLFRILHLTSVFLIDTQNKYCGQIAELSPHPMCQNMSPPSVQEFNKRTSSKSVKVANVSLWFITQHTRMCRNDHLEKMLILWLSMLPNIDQAACKAQTRGENMAGVYERRNSSIWFNLYFLPCFYLRGKPLE